MRTSLLSATDAARLLSVSEKQVGAGKLGTSHEAHQTLVMVASLEQLAARSEPRRVCRRPQLLRGRGYDEQDDEQVLT